MEQIKRTKIEQVQLEKTEEPKEPEISGVGEGKLSASYVAGTSILWRLGKAMIYFLVFLLPLFFLPWTSNILDFNKQALLLILVFLALICWLANSLVSNKFEINTSFLNFPVIILFLVTAASVIFSVYRYGSFWGWPLPVSQSLLSLLCFTVFYFLIANLFKKDEIIFLFLTLFVSGFLASLFGIFQLFGKFILPFDFARVNSFNTIGTVNSLAVYSSLLLVLLLPLLFFVKRFFKVILGIFVLILLVPLFLINFKIAWLVFLTGLAVLFAFGVVNLKKIGRSSFVTVMMIFLVIALLFALFRFPLPGLPATPLEVSITQKTELGVLRQLPLKSWFLGSGPGTFIYDWSRYKSPDLNQTIFWAVRFGNGASEVLDRIITTGILGILAFLFLIFLFFKKAFQLLVKKIDEGVSRSKISDGASWFLSLGILASFAGLVGAFFLYPVNFSILLIFWLLIGCLAVLETEKRKVLLIGNSSTKALGFSFLFVLILILGIGFSVFYVQKYIAEARYFQGLKAFQKGDSILAANYVLKAVNLNPKMDVYWRDLSQIHLIRLNEVSLKTDLTPEDKNYQVQALIASAINSASQATTLNPSDVANWNVRGFIYRNMIGGLGGAEDWAIKSYETAIDLEPTNPYIFTEIGRIYISKADLAEQQGNLADKDKNLELAQNYFEKAVSLKVDYAPAHYQMAMIYIREGKTNEAIQRLELTKQAAPGDIGLAFQLGLIYYNDNQFNKAKAEFERAVVLDSKYANARYFLGLIYDKEGNKNQAISQFEVIEEFNPENQEIKKILSNLRGGKPALEGIVPAQPPVEEKAPEQLKK